MQAFYKNRLKETSTPIDGQVVQKDDKLYVFKNGEYLKLNSEGIDTGMSLYELNKQGYGQLPAYTDEQISNAITVINEFADNNKGTYYMLLCKEMSYYTIFQRDFMTYDCLSLGHGVIECLDNIGTIHGLEVNNEQYSVEIWVKTPEDEVFCMVLFNYDIGVVKVGG